MLGSVKNTDVQAFQSFILWWYHRHGRHELPWRTTTHPYKILVSELMLQQTQVERVIPKYLAFLEQFPSVEVLAQSSLADVLRMWQGLGYNRRAKYLWQTAQKVHDTFAGQFPSTTQALQSLPGIGPYTAAAVSTFAFNNPETVIETNIRSVYIYHFFPSRNDVADSELYPLVTKSIYTENPREWYASLMDYGAHLKKILPNPSRKSRHHTKQSKFAGSPRQVRGEIIRYLSQEKTLTHAMLASKITGTFAYFEKTLADLLAEEMIEKVGEKYRLKSSICQSTR